MTGFVYRNAPKSIFHSWVEINFENQWYELEAFILDKTYIKKLQEQNSECTGAFCGYGVAVKDFRNLIIEFDRNNTYIQSEGINQDFGVYDCPNELLKEHHQEISAFLLIWYSVSTTLFQMIRSKIFISDCVVFFDTIATFTQTIAGWVVLTGKTVAQISNGISNPVVAGIIYWLIKILVYSGCLVGAGILVVFIWMKIAGLYKKYCWDMITVMVILISMAITIYFGDSIKTVLPINLLFLLLFVQLVYVGIRWYVKGWREDRGYV